MNRPTTRSEVLEQMAQRFDTYASDQLAFKRGQSARERMVREIKAVTWHEAAQDLRDIVPILDAADLIKAKTS